MLQKGWKMDERMNEFSGCGDCKYAGDSEAICILRMCKHAIKELKECYEPSAQPERKPGKWIVIDDQYELDTCKCSECGVVEYFNQGWKRFDYCPNCGADMRGE